MKKILIISIALMSMALSASGKEWKTIRIATEGAWPPFNEINKDGQVVGFEVDYAKALCDYLKVECKIVTQDWDGIIPALMANKYDAIIASMSITDERKQTIQFSKPYYTTPARFMAKKGAFKNFSVKDIPGKNVGVQKATIHENYMNDNFKGKADIKSYGKIEEAYLDLQAGRVDIVFADSVTMAFGFLNEDQGKDYEMIGPEFTDRKWFGDGVGIGLRQKDSDLKAMFDKAIDALNKNGTFKKLNDKYFSFNIGMPE